MRSVNVAVLLLGVGLLGGAGVAQDRPAGPPPGGGSGGGGGRHGGHGDGRLFISPMGEPFRVPAGGKNPIDLWFEGADTNHDGAITAAEFSSDAARFFATLDREHDGEIDPEDIDYYENNLVPEVRVGGGGGVKARGTGGSGGGRRGGRGGGGRGGGGGGGGHRGGGSQSDSPDQSTPTQPSYDSTRQGAARYGFFDYPEPITVADTDFNRGVSLKEFEAAADTRFAVLDKDGDGRITRAELPRFDPPAASAIAPTGRPFGNHMGSGAHHDDDD